MKTNQEILYDYAMSFIGLPYRWGGDDPMEGFDCSGFVIELLKSQGLFKDTEDATSQGLYEKYKSVSPISTNFGTLVFFGKSVHNITHVGFCINAWLMIEAGGGGSNTTTIVKASEQNAYIKLRPIKRRSDIVGYARPPWNFIVK